MGTGSSCNSIEVVFSCSHSWNFANSVNVKAHFAGLCGIAKTTGYASAAFVADWVHRILSLFHAKNFAELSFEYQTQFSFVHNLIIHRAISSEIHFQLSTLLVINKFHVSKSDRDIMGFVWSSNFALDLGSEILNLATLFSVSEWKKHSERRWESLFLVKFHSFLSSMWKKRSTVTCTVKRRWKKLEMRQRWTQAVS